MDRCGTLSADQCRETNGILNKRSFRIFGMCALAALICGVYAGLLTCSSVPPAEGWYSYYGYLINEQGAVPYVDFELLFPPLYVYLIAGFTRVFGYSLLAVRMLGVALYAAIGVFSCLIFEKLTGKLWMGLLCGVLTAAALQSEIVQIFYDYIRVMDLFVLASVYFFLCYLERIHWAPSKDARLHGSVILGSVCAVLASLCKQSSGLVFLLFCFAFWSFLLIVLPRRREMLVQLATLLGVTVLIYGAMAIFLASQGALGAYWKYNFVSALDAKGGGSVLSLLFGWLPGLSPWVILGVALGAMAAVGGFLWLRRLWRKYPAYAWDPEPRFVRRWGWIAVVALPILTVLPFLFAGYAKAVSYLTHSVLLYFAFFVGTAYFVVTSFWLILRQRYPIRDMQKHGKYVFVSGVIFVLGFSVSMSGGLCESQTALAYGFLFVLLIEGIPCKRREIAVAILCAVMLTQVGAAFGRKVNSLYSWWYLETGSYAEQTETCEVPLFAGVRMTEEYREMYNHVYFGIREHTDPEDEIVVFPHIPILYLATERPRATFTAVQWFDVSTDEAVRQDIEVIREKLPKAVVICTVPDEVIESHEERFRLGEVSGLHEMQAFLLEFVEEQPYRCLSRDEISAGYEISVWVLE